MTIWEILGNEYKAPCDIYDGPFVIPLKKGETFVLVGIDEDKRATIVKTSPSEHTVDYGKEIWLEYEYLAGSLPTGRCITDDSDILGMGYSGKEPLPAWG